MMMALQIGEYLIQIVGMQCMNIELHLGGMRVIFSVDNQGLVDIALLIGKHNIALHCRQHHADAIVQSPVNLRCSNPDLRVVLLVVFQNELLVEPAHPLLVQEVHHFDGTVALGLKESLDHQVANRDKEPISLIIPVVVYRPVDSTNIHSGYISKVYH